MPQYKRGPAAFQVEEAFKPDKTYDPRLDLSPEDLKEANKFQGGASYSDEVNKRLPAMNRLEQILKTHLLNSNKIQKGVFEQ